MKKNIAVIEGDGIGPEVTRQSVRVLNAIAQAFGHEFNYSWCLMGADAIEKTGNPLPDETIAICLNSDAILFGAIGDPKYDNDPTAKVRPEQGLLKLRKSLKLFANIRPVSTYASLQHLSPLKSKNIEGVDFVIFRELTGGIYFGKKELSEDGNTASDDCIYSREEIERIAHLAFQYAEKRRKKLTLVDKANVLDTSRLWRSGTSNHGRKPSGWSPGAPFNLRSTRPSRPQKRMRVNTLMTNRSRSMPRNWSLQRSGLLPYIASNNVRASSRSTASTSRASFAANRAVHSGTRPACTRNSPRGSSNTASGRPDNHSSN